MIQNAGESRRWVLHLSVARWVLKRERISLIELSPQNLPQNPSLSIVKKFHETSSIHGRMQLLGFFFTNFTRRQNNTFFFQVFRENPDHYDNAGRNPSTGINIFFSKSLIAIRCSINVRPPLQCYDTLLLACSL